MHKHPVAVEGFDGTLKELAEQVCRLRYDHVAAFFYYCSEELNSQANADMKRERKHLAILLTSAWGITRALMLHMEKVFRFCAPHMKAELGGEQGLPYEDVWRTINRGKPSPLH